MNATSMKGFNCPHSDKPKLCQEGFCSECQIYLDTLPTYRSISSSIYPIDSLRKQIQRKRLDAFNETCCGNREHRLQAQAMVNAYDVVLELIDRGEK